MSGEDTATVVETAAPRVLEIPPRSERATSTKEHA